MPSLAVIGTFYGRHENTGPLIQRVMLESTRPPDEFWVMCETEDDYDVADQAAVFIGMQPRIVHLPTPSENGSYSVIPYSHKINWALDRSEAEYIVYLDNGSMPHPDKYRLMAQALDENRAWGAVYCGQSRTGIAEMERDAAEVIADAYCVLNYTQVMHRKTKDRWTLHMQYADPDLADALFWRSLHASLGAFYPVPGILDAHHIEASHAAGL